MFLNEFEILLNDLAYLKKNLKLRRRVATSIYFEDKILLMFIWIVKYVDYSILSQIFSIYPAVISNLITVLIPLLVGHFVKFIPNEIDADTKTSQISENIVAVIDSTIHATNKPASNQHLHYSNHHKRHGMVTSLLVNFDGYISCFVTGGLGRMHDANAARFMECFVEALNGKFALGDPAYEGVDYVISGFKTNQLKNDKARHIFDRISRSEQVIVEHVNLFIKTCKTLSKRNQFIHSRHLHIGCVFIVCGWYNWMKLKFNKFS